MGCLDKMKFLWLQKSMEALTMEGDRGSKGLGASSASCKHRWWEEVLESRRDLSTGEGEGAGWPVVEGEAGSRML